MINSLFYFTNFIFSLACREAFLLSRYEGLSYKEVAQQLDISVNTVEKHIGKALRLLRLQLGGNGVLLLLLLLCTIASFCLSQDDTAKNQR